MPSSESDFFYASSIQDLEKKKWNDCVGYDHPFTRYEFLVALETSKRASIKSGWQPHHYVEIDKKKNILAVCPLYIKNHSFGEYIFDHAWAEAFHRYGLNYYPKLQSAIPFTPVTGDRIIISKSIQNTSKKRSRIINHIIEETKKLNVSSVHFNFIRSPEKWHLNKKLMIRQGIQFHWENNNYKTFDDFLITLSSRKRKLIKKERQCIKDNNLIVKLLNGDDIKEKHINFFYECYLDTTGRKWGSKYLTKNFFSELLKNFSKKILLIIAFKNDKMVASAINFLSSTHLYGRLWGAKYEVPFLHFELCYYQAIEYAIKNKIKIVEAGAQGEHKLQRGYMPQKIWSLHWIKNQQFSKAIEQYLDEENKLLNNQKENLEQFAPYKN